MPYFQIYKVTTAPDELPVGIEPTQRVIEADSAMKACELYDPWMARYGRIKAKEVGRSKENAPN